MTNIRYIGVESLMVRGEHFQYWENLGSGTVIPVGMRNYE
jgi:hypothetical protein